MEDSPAELSGDIVDRGVILTGGGSLLKGMVEWLTTEISVPVALAQNPLESVAIGAGKSLQYMNIDCQLQQNKNMISVTFFGWNQCFLVYIIILFIPFLNLFIAISPFFSVS